MYRLNNPIGPNDISGLTPNQFLYGSSTGHVAQSSLNAYNPSTGLLVLGSANGTTFSKSTAASGAATAFTFSPSNDTALTASTEVSSWIYSAHSMQFATGAKTTQREVLYNEPTYTAVGATTITNAATLAISAAPIASTNITITNAYALWTQSGKVRLDGLIYGNAAPASTGPWMVSSISSGGVTAGYLGTDDTTGTQIGYQSSKIVISSGLITTQSVGSGSILESFGASGFAVTKNTISTSGSTTDFTYTGTSDTGLTASTEKISVRWNIGQTIQHATGALTTQRAFVIDAPTYSFVGASTITTAATVAITGPPIAGTNATITNAAALLIESGNIRFSNNSQISGAANVTYTSAGSTVLSGSTVAITPTTSLSATFRDSTFTQNNQSSGILVPFTFTAGTNTGLTASTEVSGISYTAHSAQWATGALTTQREIVFNAPTYAFVGASTITTASTVEITGAPIAGTNATITTPFALRLASGNLGFGASASLVGTTSLAMAIAGTATTLTVASTAITNTVNGGTYTINATSGGAITATTNAYTLYKGVNAGGSLVGFTYTGASDTSLTASTEVIAYFINLAQTVQHAAGALTLQRAMLIQAPTYSFVSASTITETATLAIDSAPVAGTNATITNAYAVYVQAGAMAFKTSTVANATSTDLAQIWARDIAAGRCSFAVQTEEAVAVDAALVSTHSWQIQINGSTYKIPLVFVSTP